MKNDLQSFLKQFPKLGVALSGDVESALLLREAVAAIGAENVIALTACTELLPRAKLELAKRIAKLADVEHISVPLSVLDDPGVQQNREFRCYYCKRLMFRAMQQEAWMRGYETIIDGSYAGGEKARALEELGVISPFEQCGMESEEILALSLHLPGKELASSSCLAAGIPMGTAITEEALQNIEKEISVQ